MVDVSELGYSSFWEYFKAEKGGISGTTGDDQDHPSDTMPGSSAGSGSDGYKSGAREVYPIYDGITHKLPVENRPESWTVDVPEDGVFPHDFSTWHSAYQVEYLALQPRNAEGFPEGVDGLQEVVIEVDGVTLAYYVLSDDNRAVNLMTMTLAEFSALSAADQAKFAIRLEELGRLTELGLTRDLSGVDARIQEIIDIINSSSVSIPAEDKAVFLGQLKLLVEALGGTFSTEGAQGLSAAVVAEDTMLQALSSIVERFQRANTFFETEEAERLLAYMRRNGRSADSLESYGSQGSSGFVLNSSSSDFGETIRNGYEAFMRSERAILTSDTRRAAMAHSNFADPSIDVPGLISRYQTLYESQAEAIADSGTDEIRQLNKLLQDYAAMQQLVNKQLSFYDPSKASEQRRFMNVGSFTLADGTEYLDLRQSVDDITVEELLIPYGATFQFYATDPDGNYDSFDLRHGIDPKDYDSDDWLHYAVTKDMPKFNFSLIFDGTSDIKTYANQLGRTDIAPDAIQNWDGNTLDQSQMAVLSMFVEQAILGKGDNAHPLEKLYGVDRPSIDIIDWTDNTSDGSLALMTRSQWESFSTSLSESVTILNQQNQIKQNEIDTATKQQNRHFELGNNALNKMNNILMSIGQI